MMKMHMKKIVIGLVILVILLAGATIYFYKHAKTAQTLTSTASATADAQALADKVGKLIILPTDEVPTIATVSDPSALQGQAFFAQAKVGDKVLIYTNAKIAVLYDPSVNKIVTVAPLNVGGQASGTGTTTTTTTTAPKSSTSSGTSAPSSGKTSF